MTAEQLKNSILQMAVQGKLVPQDPNDEPASELIKRIREEKEKLIKEGKIKKEKNPSYIFRGEDNIPYEKVGKNDPVSIADEVPFEIPENWEWVRLGNLMSAISDGTHKTPTYVDDGVPFLSVQNISKGYFDFSILKYITKEEHEKLIQRIKPEYGDILFCRIGTLGKAIKNTVDFEYSIFVSLGLLRPVEQNIADYIVFAINSPLGDKWIQENKVGGGTHTYKINLVDIPQMLIPLPPLSEQQRIFEKISEIKEQLETYDKTEKKLSNLQEGFPEKLKKSILQEAVMGKLVPQDENDEPASVLLERIREEKQRLIAEGKLKKDKHESIIYRRDNSHYEKLDGVERCIDDEIPFEIPDNWAWARLSSIVSILGDGIHGTPTYNQQGTVYFINGNNLCNGQIVIKDDTKRVSEEEASKHRRELSADTVLTSINGTIGNVAFYSGENVILGKSACYFNLFHGIEKEYIKLLLETDYYLKYASKVATGTTIKNVSLKGMRELLVPIPTYVEQERIVEKINTLTEMLIKL